MPHRPFMLRRLKKEVEKSLPPKEETILFTGELRSTVSLRDSSLPPRPARSIPAGINLKDVVGRIIFELSMLQGTVCLNANTSMFTVATA